MRSIKQQREFIVELDEGFSFLEAPYIELLDWAERIKNEARCDSSADIDIDALLKIIEELPE